MEWQHEKYYSKILEMTLQKPQLELEMTFNYNHKYEMKIQSQPQTWNEKTTATTNMKSKHNSNHKHKHEIILLQPQRRNDIKIAYTKKKWHYNCIHKEEMTFHILTYTQLAHAQPNLHLFISNQTTRLNYVQNPLYSFSAACSPRHRTYTHVMYLAYTFTCGR